MPARVPLIEVAGQGDGFRVRRPNGEAHAAHALALDQVRAQRLIAFVERALRVQMQVEIGYQRREAIGIVEIDVNAIVELCPDAVVPRSPG